MSATVPFGPYPAWNSGILRQPGEQKSRIMHHYERHRAHRSEPRIQNLTQKPEPKLRFAPSVISAAELVGRLHRACMSM